MRRLLVVALLLALGACASGTPRTGPNLAYARRYPGLSCAPFARALLGFQLSGEAADWWDEAAGRYDRTDRPQVGSVLVFRRAPRVPAGHVAVVSRLLDARRILVIQANWVRGELDEDQLVVDVSLRNDWTAVRVWYPPTNSLGVHIYQTYGFIIPPRAPSHDALLAKAEPVARAVSGD